MVVLCCFLLYCVSILVIVNPSDLLNNHLLDWDCYSITVDIKMSCKYNYVQFEIKLFYDIPVFTITLQYIRVYIYVCLITHR